MKTRSVTSHAVGLRRRCPAGVVLKTLPQVIADVAR
jgi:hypothetical protein